MIRYNDPPDPITKMRELHARRVVWAAELALEDAKYQLYMALHHARHYDAQEDWLHGNPDGFKSWLFQPAAFVSDFSITGVTK